MHNHLCAVLLLFVIVYLKPSAGIAQRDRIRAIEIWFTNSVPARMEQRALLKCQLVKRNVVDYGRSMRRRGQPLIGVRAHPVSCSI